MLPILAAGAVIIGGSCIAWLYNSKTEDEKVSQKNAYRERENIYSSYKYDYESNAEQAKKNRKEQAEKWYQCLLKIVSEHEAKITPIKVGLDELYKIINSEIIADSSSPYRKSALNREFARTEDAYMRLEQYRQYLNFEKQNIKKLFDTEKYEELISKEPTDALLPVEWLYPGKLVMLSLDEIGKKLDKFGHRLLFDGHNAKELQQSLAINYGELFPLLITQEDKKTKGKFFGCVARGIIYLEHIIPGRPAEMTVERALKKHCHGFLFDGLVKVNLPYIKLKNSHLHCISGQKLSIYFENYDLKLKKDPSKEKNEKGHFSPITVSETEPARMGNLGGYEIFMAVDESLLAPITNERFFSSESRWTLLTFNMETTELSLGKATVHLTCSPTEKGDGLTVVNVQQTNTPQIGVDIPFELVLVSENLEPESIFAWQYGVEQLLQFAIQATLNQQATEQRTIQAKFIRRWQAVLDYQKRYESQREIEFDDSLVLMDRNSFKLRIPYSDSALTNEDKEWNINLFKNIRNGSLKPEYSCQLQRWDYEKQTYVNALESRKNTAKYILTETGDFEIEGRFDIPKGANIHRFKFTVTFPNSPLQRQQQALDAFFEDRLIEPRLKDILLTPCSYQSEQNIDWHNQDIQWQSKLTANQQQVVETALKAKHISLIQGPPGTGKTTVIVEMLTQLLTQNPNKRILVVSQQNTAVDNSLSRFKDKNLNLVENLVNIVRIGNPEKIEESLSMHHFDGLYKEFLSEAIEYVNRSAHKLPDNLQKLSYQWKAVLLQMQNSSDLKVSDEFFSVMLANKNLIGATCVGLAARKKGVDYLEFDIAIVDEAGRATVPELLIPLLRCRKVILIGDHFQLPPSIAPILREDSIKEELPFIKQEFLEKSFFELLFEELPNDCKSILQEQFRMPPKIGDLIADLFYTKNGERQLFNGNGYDVNSKEFIFSEAIYWVDTIGKQQKPKHSNSLENVAEAQAICEFLKKLSKGCRRAINVAVITPYGAQKRKIRQLLKATGSENDQLMTLGALKIKVDTVDSFQGSEAEIVCYSTVRTQGSLKFLLDRKRLNVACSRAKENLVFFGNSEYLKNWVPNSDETNLFNQIIDRSYLTNLEDFVEFISRKQQVLLNETALLSEQSLAKDWDRPEEDEAWKAFQ